MRALFERSSKGLERKRVLEEFSSYRLEHALASYFSSDEATDFLLGILAEEQCATLDELHAHDGVVVPESARDGKLPTILEALARHREDWCVRCVGMIDFAGLREDPSAPDRALSEVQNEFLLKTLLFDFVWEYGRRIQEFQLEAEIRRAVREAGGRWKRAKIFPAMHRWTVAHRKITAAWSGHMYIVCGPGASGKSFFASAKLNPALGDLAVRGGEEIFSGTSPSLEPAMRKVCRLPPNADVRTAVRRRAAASVC